MANIKSKIKRIKQSRVDASANKETRSLIKTKIRKFNEAIDESDTKTAQAIGKETARILDKAASKGIIHDNRAATKKATIAKTLNTMATAPKKAVDTKKTVKPKAKAKTVTKAKTKPAPKKEETTPSE
jgi:small subunit ribosomal protein S20